MGKVRSPWSFSFERDSDLNVSQHCDRYVCQAVFLAGRSTLIAGWEKQGKPEFWSSGDGISAPEFRHTLTCSIRSRMARTAALTSILALAPEGLARKPDGLFCQPSWLRSPLG